MKNIILLGLKEFSYNDGIFGLSGILVDVSTLFSAMKNTLNWDYLNCFNLMFLV